MGGVISPSGSPTQNLDFQEVRYVATAEGNTASIAALMNNIERTNMPIRLDEVKLTSKKEGVDDLKKALLDRKEMVFRHLTSKMLGYALGRGLTLNDSCTVDQILAQLGTSNYSGQTLIRGIVLSKPFRFQAATIKKP